jgi:hypothetical protein
VFPRRICGSSYARARRRSRCSGLVAAFDGRHGRSSKPSGLWTGMRTMMTLPHDLTAEGDVIAGAAVEPGLRVRLSSVDPDVFYDCRHGRLWAAMRFLQARDELHPAVEIRIDGRTAELADALGHQRARVVRTVASIESALEVIGSRNPRGDRRHLEQVLAESVLAGPAALDRVVHLAERRRYILTLIGEESAADWPATS